MGRRTRGQKRLNSDAQIEWESVSLKSSGQANKVFIRRATSAGQTDASNGKTPDRLLVPYKHTEARV